MKARFVERDCRAHDPTHRAVRVFRYLRDNPGPQPRDKVMHWTGFPSPKVEPVGAYASFASCIMALDAALRGYDRKVSWSPDTELYEIVEAAPA